MTRATHVAALRLPIPNDGMMSILLALARDKLCELDIVVFVRDSPVARQARIVFQPHTRFRSRGDIRKHGCVNPHGTPRSKCVAYLTSYILSITEIDPAPCRLSIEILHHPVIGIKITIKDKCIVVPDVFGVGGQFAR